MSESGWQIPNDWNNTDWDCWIIRWPGSEQYRRLLVSMLYALTRGREWDGESGTVTEAQETAWQIFDENIPLAACVSEQPEAAPDVLRVLAGIVIEGETMGQVVTEVKFVDGKLRVYYGHCCYEDLDVAGIVGDGVPDVAQPGENDAIVIPDESAETWVSSACAKSSKVVAALVDMVDVMLDSAESLHPPFLMHNALRDRLPGISFGLNDLSVAYSAALVVRAQGLASETEDATLVQELRYRFASVLDGSLSGVTADQYSALVSALDAALSEYFNLTTYPTAFNSMATVWRYALRAIGANDIRDMTSYLVATGEEDCSNPVQSVGVFDPSEYYSGDWFVDYNLAGLAEKPFDVAAIGGNNTDWDFVPFEGIRAISQGTNTNHQLKVTFGTGTTDPYDIRFIYGEFDTPVGFYDGSQQSRFTVVVANSWQGGAFEEIVGEGAQGGTFRTGRHSFMLFYNRDDYTGSFELSLQGYIDAAHWQTAGAVGCVVRRLYVAGVGPDPGGNL